MKKILRLTEYYVYAFFCCVIFSSALVAQEPQADMRQLAFGEKIERNVVGQQAHIYTFTLKKGQVVKADFLEKGADVFAVAARDSDGQLVSAYSNSGSGFMRESLTFIAEQDGIYGIIVRAQKFTRENIAAKYELSAAVKDSADFSDGKRIEAEKLLQDAHIIFGTNDTANFQTAISKLQEALKIWQSLGDRYWEATTNNLLGSMYVRTAEYSKAETVLLNALSFFDKINYKGETASIYISLGSVYKALQNEPKSGTYSSQGLEIQNFLGDSRQQVSNFVGSTLDLVDVSKGAGNAKAAEFNLENFNRELTAAKSKGDKATLATLWAKNLFIYVLNDPADKEESKVNLSEAQLEERRRREHQAHLDLISRAENEGLKAARQVKDRNAEKKILFSLGELYSEEYAEDDDENQTKAKAINEKEKNYYLQSLILSKNTSDPLFEVLSYGGLSDTTGLKNNKFDIFLNKQTVNAFQKFRQTLKASVDKETSQYLTQGIDKLYEEIASDLLLEKNRLGEALQIINLGRDQEFYDFKFVESQKSQYLTLTPREESNNKRFEAALNGVASKYAGLPNPDYNSAADEFLQTYGEVEKNFTEESSNLDVIGNVPDLDNMKTVLRDLSVRTGKNHAALYVSADASDFLLITKDGIKAFSRTSVLSELDENTSSVFRSVGWKISSGEVSREAVEAELDKIAGFPKEKFLEYLEENDDDESKKPLEFLETLKNPQNDPRPAGAKLYKQIFKSEESWLPVNERNTLENELARNGINVILWSLRGALRYVPVAALYDKDTNQYLVEKYESVMFTRANKDRLLAEPKAWTNGMGFAAPDAPGFNPIESAKKEVDSIFGDAVQNRKGYFSGQVFIGRNFTKQSFLTVSQNKPAFVHIASHFNFAAGDARKSYLVLGDGDTFPLIEMQKSINFQGIDLLTLSACETAAQQADADGKEIDGFAELAQRLGANSVIATLWKVDDTGSEKLMAEFYRLRQTNPTASKSEILRLAQLSLLKLKVTAKEDEQPASTGRGATVTKQSKPKEKPKPNNAVAFKRASAESLEHPFYWASFVLFGSSNGGKSADAELFPKPVIKPANGNSNTNESVLIRPSELIGTWEGLFDQQQYFCILEIESVNGNTFYGTLKPQGGSISVSGYIDPATRRINFNEIKILSLGGMQSWTLGSNQGSFSGDGKSISGTGFAGNLTYNWSFSKKGAGGGLGLTANSSNAVVTLGQIESSFKSGLYDETIRLSRIYLQSAPDSKDANVYLGLSYLVKKDGDSALPFLEKAVSLGQPVPIPVKRLREPILGHAFEDVTIVISNNELGIVSGNTIFKANFTDLTEVGVLNYDNQCGIAHLKGIFTESANKSGKQKQDKKQFNLFPPGSYLLPRVQGNLTLNFAACRNEESYISATIINLIQRLAAKQR